LRHPTSGNDKIVQFDLELGALPQTPNVRQSQAIDWHSGYGVKSHLKINHHDRPISCG
jgi:hypothetical protein